MLQLLKHMKDQEDEVSTPHHTTPHHPAIPFSVSQLVLCLQEEEDEHEEEAYYRLAQLSTGTRACRVSCVCVCRVVIASLEIHRMFPHTEENLWLEHLTPEQREDFKRSLVDGRISDMITPWQPWWLQPASGTHQATFPFFPPLFGLQMT